jgi:hypothetical protein
LSPEGRRLLELVQQVDFGYIEDLPVLEGVPVLHPPPRIVRVIKLREFEQARAERAAGDFALKAQMLGLLMLIREIGNGTVKRIEIQNGLPVKVEVEGIGES